MKLELTTYLKTKQNSSNLLFYYYFSNLVHSVYLANRLTVVSELTVMTFGLLLHIIYVLYIHFSELDIFLLSIKVQSGISRSTMRNKGLEVRLKSLRASILTSPHKNGNNWQRTVSYLEVKLFILRSKRFSIRCFYSPIIRSRVVPVLGERICFISML